MEQYSEQDNAQMSAILWAAKCALEDATLVATGQAVRLHCQFTKEGGTATSLVPARVAAWMLQAAEQHPPLLPSEFYGYLWVADKYDAAKPLAFSMQAAVAIMRGMAHWHLAKRHKYERRLARNMAAMRRMREGGAAL